MNRKSLVKSLAQKYGWTIVDVERSLAGQSLDELEHSQMLDLMLQFAGSELKNRQYLQAAQKSQVTKKRKALDASERLLIQTTETYEHRLEEERSRWHRIISRLYKMAQPLGLKDKWLEDFLRRSA